MAKVTLFFVIDDERDKDIYDWYQSFLSGNRSKAIRDAIRDARLRSPQKKEVTLEDVLAAIKELRMSGISVANRANDELLPEDLDLLDALDDLGR